MPSHVKVRHLIPALIALSMIICGVVVSAVNTRNNLRDSKRVVQSRKVLLAVQDTLRYALDLETGQRGFVLLGEPAYLEPYLSATRQVDEQLDSLARLTQGQPAQQARTAQLGESVRNLEKSLRRTIETRREQGLDAAIALIRSGSSKAEMDHLRHIVDEMRQEEMRLLETRSAKLDKSLRRTDLTVFFSGVVAIGAGVLGAALLLLFLSSRDREESLRAEKEKAEAADRAKSEFLAMMSHEIRTPMNAILGFGELLHDLVESPQQKHFAGAILSSGNALLSLINDILDLSKIEAGKIDLVPEVVSIEGFAKSIETLFSFRAAEKGLDYRVTVAPEVPALLSFDALRLRQILVNLVGNAIKFCREGAVTVHFRTGEPEGDTLPLLMAVEDSGIGIAPEQLTDIFRPFYQVDSRQNRHFQGTGLGLTICRRLAGVMGGSLTVESEPGKGSVFRVRIPTTIFRQQEETPATALEADAPVDFARFRPSVILVADDEPLNRELIRSYLAGSGHEILEAETGEQAVAICRTRKPDIVLMDIRMPAMDGREALDTLRAREETRDIPLVAVTASSLLNSQSELKAIFDSYADKPLNRRKLFLELAKFLPPAAPPEPAAPAAAGPPPPAEVVSADLSELCEELEALHQSVWPDLAKLVPAQGTLNFAAQLATLAGEYHSAELLHYADSLLRAAETMDFGAAGRILRDFPRLIASLRTS